MTDWPFLWTAAKNIGGAAVVIAGVGFVGYAAVMVFYHACCAAVDRFGKMRHLHRALIYVLRNGATDAGLKAAAERIGEASEKETKP